MTAPTADAGQVEGLPATHAEAAERTRLADKRLATVRAELAFKSVVVHVVDDGYLACKFGYCKPLATIDALEAFAVQVGARSA